MKKILRYGLAIGLLSIIAYVSVIIPGEAKNALITINDIEYKMQDLTLQEFLDDGFKIQMSIDKMLEGQFTPYGLIELKARTAYNDGLPLYKVNGTGGQPILVWIYNPKEEIVPIRQGKINAVSCDIPSLIKQGVKVEVAGLLLEAQTKEEILTWMNRELKVFEPEEGRRDGVIWYQYGKVSYTFCFDENEIISEVIVRKNL